MHLSSCVQCPPCSRFRHCYWNKSGLLTAGRADIQERKVNRKESGLYKGWYLEKIEELLTLKFCLGGLKGAKGFIGRERGKQGRKATCCAGSLSGSLSSKVCVFFLLLLQNIAMDLNLLGLTPVVLLRQAFYFSAS